MGGQDKILEDHEPKLSGSNFLNLGERELSRKGSYANKTDSNRPRRKARHKKTKPLQNELFYLLNTLTHRQTVPC